ncbi:MAG: hypothetical protein UH850_12845 [Paludibacteraceae bacterium]|nr:hypothetical protein [Paludibacteraceae bacterium]
MEKRYLLKSISITIFAFLILVSCDPVYDVDVYLKNSTSQTISFRAIHRQTKDTDSIKDYFPYLKNRIDAITLRSGEEAVLFHYDEMGCFSREEISGLMTNAYRGGIEIEFEQGDPYVYYPDSADSDFHSPYDYKSFFYREKEEDNEAVYQVLY